jgi:predicted nucleic acid-binding protein
MKTVTISGWKVGFQKVRFTELLRGELGYSLSKAKAATDDVLDYRHLELAVPDAAVDRLMARLSDLGAEVHQDRADPKVISSQLEFSKS